MKKSELAQIIREEIQNILKENTTQGILKEVDLNDPVLIAVRAAKMNREKGLAAQKARMKKRVYGKQRERLQDELWQISRELKDAYAERSETYKDMEALAGQKGDAWSDQDADKYGFDLNKIDDTIENLIKRRQSIEVILAY